MGKKCYIKQRVPSQAAPNATPVNSKMNPALKRAKIARKVFIKMAKVFRIALAVFRVNTKINEATKVVSNVRVVVNLMQALLLAFLLPIV